jgi:mannose-6-phosphate isomerase-like protein (cupin superfamily)
MGASGSGLGRMEGEFVGGPHGAGISVIFFRTEQVGYGPKLHTHPYPETFIVRTGRALFTVGEISIEAVAGQIVVAPASVPHKFANLGPGVLESIDIHEAGQFETAWLE